MAVSPAPYDEVLAHIQYLADRQLSGDYTVNVKMWTDGDYQIEAFHTLDTSDGTVLRERIAYKNGGYVKQVSTQDHPSPFLIHFERELAGPECSEKAAVAPTP